MTENELERFRDALRGIPTEQLYEIKNSVDAEIKKQYWSDANFSHRDKIDSYIYITVYTDLSYHYDCLGKKAYDRYINDDNAVRIECMTKDLFPEYKVLMQKGELNGQKRV